MLVKPRLLVEHDLGDGLHLPGNKDVWLDRDNAACNRDIAKLVLEVSGNDFFVVPEENLVNELIGAVLPCVLKDTGPALVGELSIVLVIYEVIIQDVEPHITGDAAQVIHQVGEIMLWYEDFDARTSDAPGELRKSGGHLSTRLWNVDGNEREVWVSMNWNNIYADLKATMNGGYPLFHPGIVATRHARTPPANLPETGSCDGRLMDGESSDACAHCHARRTHIFPLFPSQLSITATCQDLGGFVPPLFFLQMRPILIVAGLQPGVPGRFSMRERARAALPLLDSEMEKLDSIRNSPVKNSLANIRTVFLVPRRPGTKGCKVEENRGK